MNKLPILCYIFILSILLSGCETLPSEGTIPSAAPKIPTIVSNSPTNTTGADQIKRANQLYQQGRYQEASYAYYNAGIASRPPARSRLILQAIELAAIIPDTALMEKFYKSIDPRHLSNENTARYDYTKALFSLQKRQPHIALDILNQKYTSLSSGLSKKIAQTRRRAQQQLNLGTEAKPQPLPPVTPQMTPATSQNTNQQQPLAVLLPKQGIMKKIGTQLFEGIRTGAERNTTRLNWQDSSQLDGTTLYNQSLAHGAHFIIGPFAKSKIASLASNGNLPIPVLSLNYIPYGSKKPKNLYEFGLLPEDEAIQVAYQTAKKGLKKALVIIPDTQWGLRMETAFTRNYRAQGGITQKLLRYPKQSTDYVSLVSSFMSNLDNIEMIFLAASPSQARQIYPAIRAINTTLPVYATSHIYSGKSSPATNTALDGILFTEIPYILNNPINTQVYPRLYALGLDAYNITQQFSKLKKGQSLNGHTGMIKIQANGQFHRILQWASFKNGNIISTHH